MYAFLYAIFDRCCYAHSVGKQRELQRKQFFLSLFFFFFKILFTYSWETEKERERQGYRQREKQAPCGKPETGLHPRTPGSCPELKAGALSLSHPGAPQCSWWINDRTYSPPPFWWFQDQCSLFLVGIGWKEKWEGSLLRNYNLMVSIGPFCATLFPPNT